VTTGLSVRPNGITDWIRRWRRNGWGNGRPPAVKNSDLWRRLDRGGGQPRGSSGTGSRGHAGHPENEPADRLATAAIATLRRPRPGRAADRREGDDGSCRCDRSCSTRETQPGWSRSRGIASSRSGGVELIDRPVRPELSPVSSAGPGDRLPGRSRCTVSPTRSSSTSRDSPILPRTCWSTCGAPTSSFTTPPFDTGFLNAELARLGTEPSYRGLAARSRTP